MRKILAPTLCAVQAGCGPQSQGLCQLPPVCRSPVLPKDALTREPHKLLGSHTVNVHLQRGRWPNLAQGLQVKTAVSCDLRASREL